MFDDLPDSLKEIIKNKNYLRGAIFCSIYFIIGMYGLFKYNDFLFWLNLSDGYKHFIIFLSIAPIFMGGMLVVTLPVMIWELFKSIMKSLFKFMFNILKK